MTRIQTDGTEGDVLAGTTRLAAGRFQLPENLCDQRPLVDNGDEVLILRRQLRDCPAGGSGKIVHLFFDPDQKIVYGAKSLADFKPVLQLVNVNSPADGGTVTAESWALVNAPVEKGDLIIALEFEHPGESHTYNGKTLKKTIGGVYRVDYRTPGYVSAGSGGSASSHPRIDVKRWAVLGPENQHLTPIEPEPIEKPEPVSRFTTGDRAVVGNRHPDGGVPLLTGKTVTLVRFVPTERPSDRKPGYWMIEPLGDSLPESVWEDLLVPAAPKFSIGNKVRILLSPYQDEGHRVGRIGTVVRVLPSGRINIEGSNSVVLSFAPEELELVTGNPDVPPFKPGDVVEFTEDYGSCKVGDRVTVRSVTDNADTYGETSEKRWMVEFRAPGREYSRGCFSFRVKKVTETAAPQLVFAKGDYVVLTDKTLNAPVGSTARVTENHRTGDRYVSVEWIDKNGRGQVDGKYYPALFEKWTPRSGDRVRALGKQRFALKQGTEFVLTGSAKRVCGREYWLTEPATGGLYTDNMVPLGRFEVETEEPKAPFEVGDWVELIENHEGKPAGHRFQVTTIRPSISSPGQWLVNGTYSRRLKKADGPKPEDLLSEIEVLAVADRDGDVWLQLDNGKMACKSDPDTWNRDSIEELAEDFGPLRKISL